MTGLLQHLATNLVDVGVPAAVAYAALAARAGLRPAEHRRPAPPRTDFVAGCCFAGAGAAALLAVSV